MRKNQWTRRQFARITGSVATGSLVGGVWAGRGWAETFAAYDKTKYRYIDVHTHIGRISVEYPALTVDGLLHWMDEHQIERAIVLPLVSPESAGYLQPTDRALAAAKAHPDRLVPFCCIDARTSYGPAASLRRMIEEYIGLGAKGFGEHKVGLPFNHPRMMEVYAACSEVKLPLLFHIDTQRGTDEPGMPNLESALKQFPQLKFIGHGPGFWGSISGEVKVVGKREEGPIQPGGALDRLMEKYPNLYGDLSAGSGARAMSRDPEFSRKFVIRWKSRLMFGTDYLRGGQDVPQFGIFDSMALPKEVQERVFRQNAIELLKLG